MTRRVQLMAALLGAALAAGGHTPVWAQSTTGDSAARPLSIDEAVAIAQQNNPAYRRTVISRRSAAAALRSARGGRLPQLNATLGGQYQQAGQQIINGAAFGASSDVLQSTYNIGLNYRLDLPTLLAPRQEEANVAAVDADVTGAREDLRATVRQQYLTALQSEARVTLQDTLVANAQAQLELARGRAGVGSGTELDVQRAEVALGQQRVQQLQARNQMAIDRLRLFQQMGVSLPVTTRLSSRFVLDTGRSEVPSLETLLAMAQRHNPALEALRARERAGVVGVTRARGAYLPTLTVSTGIGGYTYQYRNSQFLIDQTRAQIDAQRVQCVQLQEARAALGLPNSLPFCAAFVFTDAQAAAIRAANAQFPFDFAAAPRNVSVLFSLPLFDGFVREQQVQEATVTREDARYARRERELALTADVTAAYLTLQAARQTAALQEQNSAKARQELQFVQDQYAVGIATFVDLTTARATYAQAENDRITALYDYHKAVAALESAVGRPLR